MEQDIDRDVYDDNELPDYVKEKIERLNEKNYDNIWTRFLIIVLLFLAGIFSGIISFVLVLGAVFIFWHDNKTYMTAFLLGGITGLISFCWFLYKIGILVFN